MKTLLCVWIFLGTALARADDFKTIDGKEYKNVTVSRVEPDGIMVISNSGIVKLYFRELPKDVQQRFGYDPSKAAAYSSENAAQQDAIRQAASEAAKKQAEEKNRYW